MRRVWGLAAAVATAAIALAAAPACAFPVRQAMPDGTAAELDVDPALLPAFGFPAPAPQRLAAPEPAFGPAAGDLALPLSRATKTKDKGRTLRALGMKDGRAYGGAGRVFAYVGVGRQVVGLNMLQDAGGWRRDGVAVDKFGRTGTKGSAGFAWRTGEMQASLGYSREALKSRLFGVKSRSDDRVGVTLVWAPR